MGDNLHWTWHLKDEWGLTREERRTAMSENCIGLYVHKGKPHSFLKGTERCSYPAYVQYPTKETGRALTEFSSGEGRSCPSALFVFIMNTNAIQHSWGVERIARGYG